MRYRLTVFSFMLLMASSGGCVGKYGYDSYPEHIVFDLSHPWHSYPAQAVTVPLTNGLQVVLLPVHFVEWATSGEWPLGKTGHGFVAKGVGYFGAAIGVLVGFPFYVLGLPLEGSDERNDHSVKPVRPKLPPRPEGEG